MWGCGRSPSSRRWPPSPRCGSCTGRSARPRPGSSCPPSRQALRKHLTKRAAEGARLNINVLGEAVLGEEEATHRLDRVIEMLSRPEVTYVSVKISAIAAQLSTYDHEGSVQRVAERLRGSTGRPWRPRRTRS